MFKIIIIAFVLSTSLYSRDLMPSDICRVIKDKIPKFFSLIHYNHLGEELQQGPNARGFLSFVSYQDQTKYEIRYFSQLVNGRLEIQVIATRNLVSKYPEIIKVLSEFNSPNLSSLELKFE
jgi:hypothetical protein